MRHRLTLLAFAVWDAVALFLSYNLTYQARLGNWEGLSPGLTVMTATWLGVSYLIGRYSPPSSKERIGRTSKLGQTALAACAVIVVFVGHSWLYQVVDAQTRFRGFLVQVVIISSCLSTAGQILRSYLTREGKEWILVGSKTETETITKELRSETRVLRARTGLAKSEEIAEHIRSVPNMRTAIAVGNLNGNTQDIEELLELREMGRCVIPLQRWCEEELQRIPPELIQAEWLIQADGFGLRPGSLSWRVKRVGDVFGAAALMIATLPILAGAMSLVWCEDRGPVFYRQVRTGLYGKKIWIWKLRSMRIDSEKDGAQWATKDDPRITRVGRVIRSTRIDELPQLISVLKGDLSLIGPRPERPEIERELLDKIPNYRVRHWIRPGLSGWAQVCYPYGASIEDSRMKLSYDLFYLRNAGFLLDSLIVLKTIRLVLGAKGASPRATEE